MLGKESLISIKRGKMKLPYLYINSHVISVLIIIAFSAILSVIGLMLGDVGSLQTVKSFLKVPSLYLLNTIPLTLLMLLLYFATSRIWVSYALGGSFYIILELVNRFKIKLRDDPLMPTDISLGAEVANVIKPSELPISKYMIAMFCLFILTTIFLMLCIKSSKLKVLPRILGSVACILVFTLSFNTVYKDVKRYSTYKIRGTTYATTNIFRSRGFIYSFLISFETDKVVKPDGYSVDGAKNLLKKYDIGSTPADQKKPNVIAIMGEAFYNFDRIPGVKFTEGNNPLENYHNIINEGYYGSIVTSVFGGGTSSTEFSFLTGNSTCLLPGGITPYKTLIRNNKYSLARYFSENGYSTTAFHPGYAWFYNRQNVYRLFDFDKVIFRKDMDVSSFSTRREYVKDVDTMKYILADYDEHMKNEPQKPYFDFTVTIENHSPYTEVDYDDQIFERPAGMTDDIYNMINTYLYGLREADKALGYLVSELKKKDEPFVVIFFGDHLPFLNNDYQGYKALNYNIGQGKDLEAFLNNYETPYFIWSNKAAQDMLKSNGTELMTGKGPDISACFLATELMEYIGQVPSPYFQFLTELKKSLPIVTHKYYEQDGKFILELDKKHQDLLTVYKKLQYYMMFDNKVK